jgi:hypothetical protein
MRSYTFWPSRRRAFDSSLYRGPWSATRVCVNRRCRDVLFRGERVPLCASCRLAGAWGGLLAFVTAFVLRLLGVL